MNRPSILQAVPSRGGGLLEQLAGNLVAKAHLIVQQCVYVCFLDERVEQDGAQQRERLLAIAGDCALGA